MYITASQTEQLTQVYRQTTNKLYTRIRERIKGYSIQAPNCG